VGLPTSVPPKVCSLHGLRTHRVFDRLLNVSLPKVDRHRRQLGFLIDRGDYCYPACLSRISAMNLNESRGVSATSRRSSMDSA
jgi:hypothetical protein